MLDGFGHTRMSTREDQWKCLRFRNDEEIEKKLTFENYIHCNDQSSDYSVGLTFKFNRSIVESSILVGWTG